MYFDVCKKTNETITRNAEPLMIAPCSDPGGFFNCVFTDYCHKGVNRANFLLKGQGKWTFILNLGGPMRTTKDLMMQL